MTRVFAITAAYTAFVGVFDWLTAANYMYLAAVPAHHSLLSVLGRWPWYILSAAGVALVLLLILDAPFRSGRRAAGLSAASASRLRPRSSRSPRPSEPIWHFPGPP